MVVVGFDDDVLDLLLYADTDTLRERSFERAIDIGRKQLRQYRGVRQRAKRAPEKETVCLAHSGSGLGQVLIRTKSGQSLYVAHVNHRVRGNQRMARRDNAVEPVNADEKPRGERTSDVAGKDLCIGQVGRDAESAREERSIYGRGRQRRHTIEASGIGKRLDHATVGAAESWYVANQPETKLIVEQSVVPANDCLRRCCPGEPDARRNILFRTKLRVVIPTQTNIQRELRMNLPVVLPEQGVVVVAQVNVVRGRRQSARGGNSKESGVERSEGDEVRYGRKKLKV